MMVLKFMLIVDGDLLHEMVDVFLFHGFVWLMVFSGCSIFGDPYQWIVFYVVGMGTRMEYKYVKIVPV